ncbi:21384_t:CDS:2, partial [Racocetra persica]
GHDKNGIKRKISAIKRSTNKRSKTNTSTKKRSVQTSKKSQRTIESNLDTNLSSNTKSNNELFMMPMEKLEYEERMLLIEKRKEKLRELWIANTIKEREHGLEQE